MNVPPTAPPPGAGQASGSRLLDACHGGNASRPPVWIMRQAGRYLPEYQALRQKHSFVEMCSVPELAVEVSLQPLRRFPLDAAIVFYDILFLPEAMGASLEFRETGPVFTRPLANEADIEALHEPDLTARGAGKGTGAVLESLKMLRAEVPGPTAVLGFAGAPFTLASYLVEGSFQRSGDRIKRLLHEDPALVHRLLERLARSTGEYLAAQVEAGADAVQLFDTWAGLLGPDDFREFALPYEKAVLERVASAGAPSILYVNGCSHILEDMARSGAGVLSLDWRQPLREARRRLGQGIGLQGNLDPSALFASPDDVKRKAGRMLDGLRGDAAYIVNLGHGILPETPIASVEAFVETVTAV
ncbi:MAG TPA: uroporphyrinogen decarboxylase [Planctomycetota bacterium]|nr:uroporphyrinogen decarboxylase [Planctomycetota bacterium]